MNVLVTGGSGSVGTHLRKYLPDATFLSSNDCDLLSQYQIKFTFDRYQPDVVVHLAAIVGGLIDNISRPVQFYEDNNLMNLNLVRACYQDGVKNVLGILSTCIYPDDLPDDKYPLVEDVLFDGSPSTSNIGYAYSKRMMALHLDLYRKHEGLNYGYLIPSNLYSEFDDSNPAKSHFVTSLLHKLAVAYSTDSSSIQLLGTGRPMRQFIYSDDLAKIIALSVKSGIYGNCNVCSDENYSIEEIAKLAMKVNGKQLSIEFDGQKDGQMKKNASNAKFKQLYPDFHFTPLADGLKIVYDKISKRYN